MGGDLSVTYKENGSGGVFSDNLSAPLSVCSLWVLAESI